MSDPECDISLDIVEFSTSYEHLANNSKINELSRGGRAPTGEHGQRRNGQVEFYALNWQQNLIHGGIDSQSGRTAREPYDRGG